MRIEDKDRWKKKGTTREGKDTYPLLRGKKKKET